ncbi:MAG TPA: dephospho-CoA kinase [Polyangiaceae bacterium]|nr:dephospho-CoA kinase [Polyangiaceae bacterium]
MHLFGLTGGVASGKDVIAARFRERGVPTVDADELARIAVQPGSPALAEIRERFGPQLVGQTGELDRAALARIVFGDPEKLAQLNRIVHPRVALLLQQKVNELSSAGHTLGCYVVPLLFENGLEAKLRPVVLVAAPLEVQVQRAMARSGWSEAEARARIAAQLPLEEKQARADYVIDNGGTLQSAAARADEVLDAIRKRLQTLDPNP